MCFIWDKSLERCKEGWEVSRGVEMKIEKKECRVVVVLWRWWDTKKK